MFAHNVCGSTVNSILTRWPVNLSYSCILVQC